MYLCIFSISTLSNLRERFKAGLNLAEITCPGLLPSRRRFIYEALRQEFEAPGTSTTQQLQILGKALIYFGKINDVETCNSLRGWIEEIGCNEQDRRNMKAAVDSLMREMTLSYNKSGFKLEERKLDDVDFYCKLMEDSWMAAQKYLRRANLAESLTQRLAEEKFRREAFRPKVWHTSINKAQSNLALFFRRFADLQSITPGLSDYNKRLVVAAANQLTLVTLDRVRVSRSLLTRDTVQQLDEHLSLALIAAARDGYSYRETDGYSECDANELGIGFAYTLVYLLNHVQNTDRQSLDLEKARNLIVELEAREEDFDLYRSKIDASETDYYSLPKLRIIFRAVERMSERKIK